MGGDIDSELASASLGDFRLDMRAQKIHGVVSRDPSLSFPEMFSDSASLEGAYRFFRNHRVSWSKIFESHRLKSYERMDKEETVLAIHDTTEIKFKNNYAREGLGRLQGQGVGVQGFFAHISLAASTKGKIPLGVVGAKFYSRAGKPKRENKKSHFDPGPGKEHYRWVEQALRIQQEYAKPENVIHVMDREGDSFEIFEALVSAKARMVIRICRNRRVQDGLLFSVLENAPVISTKEIKFSRRYKSRLPAKRKRFAPRSPGETTLSVSAARVSIRRTLPATAKGPELLSLNVVQVREQEPLDPENPIDWKLITSEPIETVSQVEDIIEYYRGRWLIEEYFKVLKTACAIEQRQQESLRALLNVLAMFFPIAWKLLCLRNAAADKSPISVTSFITPTQKTILEAKFPDLIGKLQSAKHLLLAIARLGGHIKYNGDPGWIVLYRGHKNLLKMEEGYFLAMIHRDK